MAEKFTDDDAPVEPVVPLRPKGRNGNLRTAPSWQPGQSGNPAGRQRGSRNKMSENFLRDLHATWERHGALALERCAIDDPSGFVRTVASGWLTSGLSTASVHGDTGKGAAMASKR
jgi:hypothetical protein